jgi:hypothetical protein
MRVSPPIRRQDSRLRTATTLSLGLTKATD